MDRKSFIKKYFNEKTIRPSSPGTSALILAVATPMTIVSGSNFALIAAALTVGQLNKWQKDATGDYIWKPRFTETFGL